MDDRKPSKAQFVVGASLIIAIGVIAIAAGVAVLTFGAYGCGKLVTRWLPFTPFEATIVSLLALVTSIGVATKLLAPASAFQRPLQGVERCALCGGYHDVVAHDFDNEDDEEEEGEAEMTPNDGLRIALYATGAVKPNAPCPCSSGSRYSKCCGDGRFFRRRRTGSASRTT
jgi:hypothetical protein